MRCFSYCKVQGPHGSGFSSFIVTRSESTVRGTFSLSVPFPCPRYLFLVYTAWYGLLVHDRCAFGQPPCWLTHPAKSRFRRRLPELLPCRCTPGILREQAARQIIRVKRIIRRESKAISSICVWLILHCSTELDLWI